MIALTGDWDMGYAIHRYNQDDGSRTILGEAIYRYQYRKQWYLVDSLARWAQAFLEAYPELGKADLLLPVPSSRPLTEYDPSSLLADWISQLTKIPKASSTLVRYGFISEYINTVAEGANRGGMVVSGAEGVRGKEILLMDGIVCSGSTLQAASRALRLAGASAVRVLVFTKIEKHALDTFGFAEYDRNS